MIQVFETNTKDTKITKLDMIDYGQVKYGRKVFHIIFVGKVFVDKFDQPTFINMFTLALDKE